MALTLAEKHAWNPFPIDRPPCDLETPAAAASAGGYTDEEADILKGPLLTATAALVAAIILLWLSSSAVKWSYRRLLFRLFGQSRAQESEDDGSATVFGSPLTPPPNFWLHDVDVGNPAYLTPPPEPLLFSLSPAPGGGAAAQYGQLPPYASQLRTMQSAAGQGGAFMGAAGPFLGCPAYGSPDGDALLRRRSPGGGRDRARAGASPGGGGGWDRGLLSRQAALLPAISSVEGLMASTEFQEHVRCTRRRSPFLEREQSQAKVQLYKDLRRLDPGAFRRLLSRSEADIRGPQHQRSFVPSRHGAGFPSATPKRPPTGAPEHHRAPGRTAPRRSRPHPADCSLRTGLALTSPAALPPYLGGRQTYDVRPPPLLLAVADYLVGVGLLLVPLALAAMYGSGAAAAAASPWLRYGPLCVWLVVRLRLAAAGHVSLMGRAVGAYLVYDMPDDAAPGNAWEGLAGVGGHLLLDLFEVLMAGLSCGLLAVGALVSIAAGRRRQTLAMRLLGLRLELETGRPTKLSPFSPSTDNAVSVPSKPTSSQRSLGSLPGRYGLSCR